VVSAADPPRSLISVSRLEQLLFFQVAPHLSSQGLSGLRSRTTAIQKIWQRRESKPGPLGLQPGSLYSIFACLRCLRNVFIEPLPSSDRKDIHTDTQTGEMGLSCHDINVKCHQDSLKKETQVSRQHGDRNSLL
jgi:hypothetical protein